MTDDAYYIRALQLAAAAGVALEIARDESVPIRERIGAGARAGALLERALWYIAASFAEMDEELKAHRDAA